MSTIDAFLEALTLEPVGEDRYRATNLPSPHGVVFGGQLLAQSIMAGLAGQEGKAVKTLHTVFALVRPTRRRSTSPSSGCTPDAPWPAARSLSARVSRSARAVWCSSARRRTT